MPMIAASSGAEATATTCCINESTLPVPERALALLARGNAHETNPRRLLAARDRH